MTIGELNYELPNSLGTVRFDSTVIEHMLRFRQLRLWSRESGGQLFARLIERQWDVVEISGPRRTDKRHCFGYVPDRRAEQTEIAEQYRRGLHFVGDWHTHRQHIPAPSQTDSQSMRDMVTQSVHGLTGFLLVVVGNAELPAGLHVSFHTRKTLYQLHLVEDTNSPRDLQNLLNT